MFEPFQAQIYCDLTHHGRDLERTAELKRRAMRTASAFTEQRFVFPCGANYAEIQRITNQCHKLFVFRSALFIPARLL